MEGENLKLALREVGKLIKKNLKQGAKDDEFSASGDLDKSFRYRVQDNELYIFGEQYANALSGGIKKKGKYDYDMAKKLAKWAKIKGMRPMFRLYKKDVDGSYKPTGKFRKVYESSWKSLGFVLARSIAEKGISERFRYKGSGFIEAVKKETKEEIKKILKEGYRKDIAAQLKTLKAIK